MKVTTVLADNSRVFIEGLKGVLAETGIFSFEIIAVASDGLELTEALERNQPELLIFELNLPGKDGFEILRALKNKKHRVKTLAFTSYSDEKVVQKAFNLGVNAYVLKTAPLDELFRAVEKVLSGGAYLGQGLFLSRQDKARVGINNVKKSFFGDFFVKKHHLTKREIEVLELLAQAMSNKEVGAQLFISHETVGVHRKNIMRKLGVSNTAALLKTAYENKLL